MRMVILALLLLSLTPSVSAEISDAANMQVTLINQEPNPVEMGEHLILRFRIENLGSRPAPDVKFGIVPEFPFSIASGESAERRLGTIAGRQKDKIGAVVSYDMVVDSSASEGTKQLYVRYATSDGVDAKMGPFNITIRARQAVIGISSAISNPEQVLPGQRLNMTLVLTNNARSLLKDIQVKLDLSGSAPFAPLGSSQEKSLSQLSPGSSESFAFSLVALPDTAAGIYKIPVSLKYTDQVGKNFTKDDLVALVIGGAPQVTALVSEQDTLKEGKPGSVTVQIVNNGLVDMKLATIELEEAPGYEAISPKKIYIGSIDSDDFDTARFNVYVKKAEAGRVVMPVRIIYMDANNNQYEETFELEPRVYTSGEANRFGLEKRSMTGLIIIVLIVASGLLIYRKFFRKKESGQ